MRDLRFPPPCWSSPMWRRVAGFVFVDVFREDSAFVYDGWGAQETWTAEIKHQIPDDSFHKCRAVCKTHNLSPHFYNYVQMSIVGDNFRLFIAYNQVVKLAVIRNPSIVATFASNHLIYTGGRLTENTSHYENWSVHGHFYKCRVQRLETGVELENGYITLWTNWDCNGSVGVRGGVVAKALRYKSAGRGFDSRLCQWNFSVT
jgi:hypothetical protein